MRTPRKHPFICGLVAAGATLGIALSGATTAAAAEPAPMTITPLETVAIEKVIAGLGAGMQDEIVLHVSGTGGLEVDIVIPAGATGTVTTVIDRVPVDTVLTITEPQSGANTSVTVSATGLGESTVEWNEQNSFTVTNTYTPVDPIDPPLEPVEPVEPPVDPIEPVDPPVDPVEPIDPPVAPPVVPEIPSTVVPPIAPPVQPEVPSTVEPGAPSTTRPTLRPVTGELAVTGSSPWALAGSLTLGGALVASGGALMAAQRRRAA